MVNLSEFKDLYIKTAKENIESLKQGLDTLSQQAENPQAIEQVHRASHTLKSKSLVMGYTNIAYLSKAAEDIFFQIKQGENKVSLSLLSLLNEIIPRLEEAIKNVEIQNKDIDLSDEIEKLDEALV